jgi:hypothetical protein
MKEFTDLLKKKAAEQGKEPISPEHMEAKASAIKSLMSDLKHAMGGELHDGLKKVTVASDSQEGLKKGLDLAKKVVPTGMGDHNAPTPEGVADLDPEELEESPEFEASENEADEEQGSDEDRKIAELHKQIAEISAKKKAKPSN